jgi:uncharacterized protein (TIGR03083 family)
VGIADDFVRERAALRATLVEVGPDAPTACGDWSAADLAVHVAVGETSGGWPTVPFRLLVNRGIRVDRMAPVNAGALRLYRRRGWHWAMRRLARNPPRAHLLRQVVPVSLLEVWAHHEDVLIANDLTCDTAIDLQPVVELLRRYQRTSADGDGTSLAEEAQQLAGRAGDTRFRL